MRGAHGAAGRKLPRGAVLAAALALLAILVGVAHASSSSAASGNGLDHAIAVQERNAERLLDRGAVVGTGVGWDSSGPEIVVLAKRQIRVAKQLGGVPVTLSVTGPIRSLRLAPGKKPENPGKGGGGGGEGGEADLSPTDLFPRPVPIGVSTGNVEECSAGTIGARVKDGGGNLAALSNNHVYALENTAAIGSAVLQPGRYDTGCVADEANAIGALSAFVPLSFTENNEVDAAIASIDSDSNGPLVGNSTPPGGYGTPSSATLPALQALQNPAVQKYGRTTGETHGRVYAINGIVNVGYRTGTARFVNQVFVEGMRGPFIKAGDSGSLLVTGDADARPVGLLFAGSSSGKFAVANQIDAVLAEFGVTIDGK